MFIFPTLAFGDTLLGEARNSKGEVIYLETHEIQKDKSGSNSLIRVEYKKPNGEIFATMTSDFSKDPLVPKTVFEDTRFNTKIVLENSDGKIVFEELKNDKQIAKKSISKSGLMVASQGFDNFIRSHADQLSRKPVDFKFGVLSKMDFYSLTGYQKDDSTDSELKYGIQPSSWFIRLFAGELNVVYDRKTMRLKTFKGRSNLLDDRGGSQDVTITYKWKD